MEGGRGEQSQRADPRARRVWLLNAGILVVAAALVAQLDHGAGAFAAPELPWWVIAAGAALAERAVVHVHFRRSAHSFSLGELPLVFGLVFSSPSDLLLGMVVGTAPTLLLDRRLPPIKLVFNLGQFVLVTALAVLVFRLIARSGDPTEPVVWLAVLAATAAAGVIASSLIAAAISFSERPVGRSELVQMIATDGLVNFTNTSLALAGAVILALHPGALPLLIVPVALVFLAYHGYLSEMQRHNSLEFLYETTRTLSRTREIAHALEGLLAHSLDAFRIERAEVVLFPPPEGGEPTRTTLTHTGANELMTPLDPAIAEELRRLAAANAGVVTVSAPFGDDPLGAYLESRGVTHAMLAPLAGEQRVIGCMLLANREGVVQTFTEQDAKLFEALANNASVALQYDRMEQAVGELRRLQEQLEHQAFHDALTGLPNRSRFTQELDAALSQDGMEVAVLFIDLDDFKLVNDSMGHAAGDALLVAVGRRLSACVRPSDTVARLGGDEFAVLMRGCGPELDAAITVAQRIRRTLRAAIRVADDRRTSARPSIGIAGTQHSREANELLRNADLAMYEAKRAGKDRWAIFEPGMHANVVRRHGLRDELEVAIETGALQVHYQPIVELRSGVGCAVEALVRWNHHARGMVSPTEFIPLAEENGLIVALGRVVLDRACRDAADFNAANVCPQPVAVHVNLSPAELEDPNLVAVVQEALQRNGLAPSNLVLEITESLLLDDATVAFEILNELRGLGVRLALDDFGTGYSSLSYLRALPLDLLKVAKPFVDGMSDGARELAFMRMIVDLGRTLDLRVVAEGVETPAQHAALCAMGCDLAQGFLYARATQRITLPPRVAPAIAA